MNSYITGKKFIFYSILLFVIIFVIIIFVFRNNQLKNIIIASTENIEVFFTQKTKSFLIEFNKEILHNPKFLKMEKYGGNNFDLEIREMGKQNPFMLPATVKPTNDGTNELGDGLSDLMIDDF